MKLNGLGYQAVKIINNPVKSKKNIALNYTE